MTHLSSRRKSTSRNSYNTLTVLNLPSSLKWKTTRRMGTSPSWMPLLNQRLMGICLPLCTVNLPTQTSTYSGTVTTTSEQNLVLSAPSPIGPKTVCSNPELLHIEMDHLRKALTQCKYPKWALDKVE